jgi:hypothetical protein
MKQIKSSTKDLTALHPPPGPPDRDAKKKISALVNAHLLEEKMRLGGFRSITNFVNTLIEQYGAPDSQIAPSNLDQLQQFIMSKFAELYDYIAEQGIRRGSSAAPSTTTSTKGIVSKPKTNPNAEQDRTSNFIKHRTEVMRELKVLFSKCKEGKDVRKFLKKTPPPSPSEEKEGKDKKVDLMDLGAPMKGEI